MNKCFSYIVAVAFVFTTTFISCNKDKEDNPKITIITTFEGDVAIALIGIGEATIDWGDGNSETVILTTPNNLDDVVKYEFLHTYTAKGMKNIIITGDNIVGLAMRLFMEVIAVDISKNTALEILICMGNKLTSLDVSKNIALKSLYCNGNQLTSLDVSKNTALEILDCSGNQLQTLDVSKNSMLQSLSCPYNQLTSLNISECSKLIRLICNDNQLISLDMSNNTELEDLQCKMNNMNAVALNAMYDALPDRIGKTPQGTINVIGNPGIYRFQTGYDRTKATDKNWTVIDYY